ncbi:hypothetical protein H696_00768 [Fonticula alba]|uniref:RNA helicase n=1 Tax=Fonticula alba TaxID=691883 RepID=A0A058ZGY4_FONAL|nr:hypothetical protein H696_00768 [Fonticula alba]KCV73226.1 hypothetical protein H696_00768 [Fonticula alba]|eukprot:XP_009492927.1 hypothetical protein H696_00768 [Fonticula alba]
MSNDASNSQRLNQSETGQALRTSPSPSTSSSTGGLYVPPHLRNAGGNSGASSSPGSPGGGNHRSPSGAFQKGGDRRGGRGGGFGGNPHGGPGAGGPRGPRNSHAGGPHSDGWRAGRHGGYGGASASSRASPDPTSPDGMAAPAAGNAYTPAPRCPEREKALFGDIQPSGINFEQYKEIPVEISGSNPPEPIESFKESPLHDLLQENIILSGYTVPTPVQRYSIPITLDNRDLMACAQTGSGKTGGFLFPIISQLMKSNAPRRAGGRSRNPSALILTPTRELAIQIHKEAEKFTYRSHISSIVIYGGGGNMQDQMLKLRSGADIIVATPGRLTDMIKRDLISLTDIQFLVLDEADRMLDMGFEDDINAIVKSSNMPPPGVRRTLLFSATFPELIQRLAQEFLHDYIFLTVGTIGAASHNVDQTIVSVSDNDKLTFLQDLMDNFQKRRESEGGLMLVFVETKRSANLLDTLLSKAGFETTSIHGDRDQSEREIALEMFRSHKTPFLIATAVAARGLDIPNVTFVVNYDMPKEIDEYIHRIGRTGRAGHRGRAMTFFSARDAPVAPALVNRLQLAGQEVPEFLLAMTRDAGRTHRRGPAPVRPSFASQDFRENMQSSGAAATPGAGGARGNNRGSDHMLMMNNAAPTPYSSFTSNRGHSLPSAWD